MPQPFRIPIYKTAPFIRLLLPLIAGVILQRYVQITLAVIVIAAVSFGIAILLFNFLPLALRFKLQIVQGFLINASLLSFGLLITWQKNVRHSNNWYGNYSMALGYYTKSKSLRGFVAGAFNDSTNAANAISFHPLNRIFQIGNGNAVNARSNAMTVLQNGNVGIGILTPNQMLEVAGNLTVQNGKGIIRSNDGTQQKKVTKDVTINTSFTAGETKSFATTWPETFGAAPDVFVGHVVSGAGGWAELVLTITNPSTTGAILYVYNPKTITVNPNYTNRIIAIGPQ